MMRNMSLDEKFNHYDLKFKSVMHDDMVQVQIDKVCSVP